MDIYILREGKEIGPFNETKTHALLNQGSIGMSDLSWCPGMSKWLPLADVMSSLPTEEAEPGESFAAPEPEVATTRAKWATSLVRWLACPVRSRCSAMDCRHVMASVMDSDVAPSVRSRCSSAPKRRSPTTSS